MVDFTRFFGTKAVFQKKTLILDHLDNQLGCKTPGYPHGLFEKFSSFRSKLHAKFPNPPGLEGTFEHPKMRFTYVFKNNSHGIPVLGVYGKYRWEACGNIGLALGSLTFPSEYYS